MRRHPGATSRPLRGDPGGNCWLLRWTSVFHRYRPRKARRILAQPGRPRRQPYLRVFQCNKSNYIKKQLIDKNNRNIPTGCSKDKDAILTMSPSTSLSAKTTLFGPTHSRLRSSTNTAKKSSALSRSSNSSATSDPSLLSCPFAQL